MKEQKFVVRRNWAWLDYQISFYEKLGDNRIAIAQPAQIKVEDSSQGVGIEPHVLLTVEEAGLQSLMDELWNVGIRPKDIGTAGHLAATQEHLKDMKKLVSKAFDVEL